MRKLFYKELKLILSPVLYLFTAMTILMFIPTFPPISNMAYSLIGLITVLNGAIGDRDFEFTALLPVPRRYIVLSKCFDLVYSELLQLLVAIPCAIIIINVRGTSGNVINQNPNLFFFAMVLVSYGVFNIVFLPWFFKTAEKVNKPLLTGLFSFFIMAVVYSVIVYFVPALNEVGAEAALFRIITLIVGIVMYVGITYLAYRLALNNFKKVSL